MAICSSEWPCGAENLSRPLPRRQSSRAKHLLVEEQRLAMLQQGLERRQQDLEQAEELTEAALKRLLRGF